MTIEAWTGSDVDVAIVGAGAAGIAAGRRLQSLRPDLSLVLLEASDRIGGRAWTLRPGGRGGAAIVLGCGWLHGAMTNPWTAIAGELGLAVDHAPAPWNEGGRQLEKDPAEAEAAGMATDEFLQEIHDYRGKDSLALQEMVAAGNPWEPHLQATGAFITGGELHQSSVVDLSRYNPGQGQDWRVREGYGTLVATYAKPLPVQLAVEVTGIDHAAAGHVVVTTTKGDLRARAVIVTVSTNVLASGKIAFWPPLPDKIEAAARLPLGLANKLFMRVKTPGDFPVDTHVLGSYHARRTGAYQMRPFGNSVIEGYFAGDLARDLELQGQDAAFDFAVAELTRVFGSDVRQQLSPLIMSSWAAEPHIRGSYSYATPGAADLRGVLAAPCGDRLFFAGEATSRMRYSTAHGAYESGFDAADAVAGALP